MRPVPKLEGLEPLRDGRLRFWVPGEVVPWARARTKAGKHYWIAQPQAVFGKVLRDFAGLGMGGMPLIIGPVGLRICALYPWPKRASKARRSAANEAWKATAPDLDNIVKLVSDALQGVVYANDGQIADLRAFKLHGLSRHGLDITITPLAGVAPEEIA